MTPEEQIRQQQNAYPSQQDILGRLIASARITYVYDDTYEQKLVKRAARNLLTWKNTRAWKTLLWVTMWLVLAAAVVVLGCCYLPNP